MNKYLEEIIKRVRDTKLAGAPDSYPITLSLSDISSLCDEIERQNDQATADTFAGLAMQSFLTHSGGLETGFDELADDSYNISAAMMIRRKLNMKKD